MNTLHTACVLVLVLAALPALAVENIALNAAYTMAPAPNYEHCLDPGDTTQLTDGQYVSGHFWTQPGCVGWSGQRTVIVTIDLGADQPIGGISFGTAAGAAGVKWPESLTMLVAGDDGLFHYVGDLVALSARKSAPPAEGYATHRFQTEDLRTHGRKLALVVNGEPFTFCDEIEVFKGDDAWLAEPLPGPGEPDVAAWTRNLLVHEGVKRRIKRDATSVREAAGDLPESARAEISAQLDAALAELDSLPVEYGPDFKTVFPINATHARVFDALARVWREKGMTAPKLWAAGAWDPLELAPAMPGPEAEAASDLRVDMMLNEYRAVAFNIAAPADCPNAAVVVQGLPGGDNPPYVDVREVAWTDTRTGKPVAAALLPAPLDNGRYIVSMRPGLVRQVWLTFNPRDVPPGVYDGAVLVNDMRLPLRLHVYPLTFPERPTLHFGGWDYTNVAAHYEVTVENMPAVLQHLREHFVDSPWATAAALPLGKHDASGAMVEPPETVNFDEWLKLWPDARRYCVFPAVGGSFQQWAMGTPEFDRAVGDWAKFWAGKMREKNLEPGQLMVLLVDEPREPEHDTVIAAWARAIRASGAGIRVWEDPIHADMTKASAEMLDLCDVLCPNRPSFLKADEAYKAVFLDRAKRTDDTRVALEFYSCSGPMRLLDPYNYCRIQGWDCWRYGADASYFWAFADAAGGPSWNEYAQPRPAYTPLFIDPQGVTPGKHLEACREGIEDYEYFVMLRDGVNSGRGSEEARAHAAHLLAELPERVAGNIYSNRFFAWTRVGLPTPADAARIEILEALEALK